MWLAEYLKYTFIATQLVFFAIILFVLLAMAGLMMLITGF